MNAVLATEHWSLKPHGHLLQNKSSQGIRHFEPRVGHRFSSWSCSLWTPRAALPPVQATTMPSSSGKISVSAPIHCSCLLLHRWRCSIILVQGNQPQVPESKFRISLKFVNGIREPSLTSVVTQASYNRISDESHNDIQQRQPKEAESKKEVELASQSCNQKLIVVIAADEQCATKHWRVSEACPSEECRGSVYNRPDAKHQTRFSWIDRDVLMASLCYSMTGLIFIITGMSYSLPIAKP